MVASKIMLALDDPSAINLIPIVENLGYQIVASVSDGELVAKKAADLRPDLIIISMQLNGKMSGVEVGSHIYNKYDIPIIYIAGQSGDTTIRRSRGTAPFGYMFGNLDEKQILATIEVALTRHSMEKKVRESEQWLNGILHSIGDAVIAVDHERQVRYMNPVAQELTGKSNVDSFEESKEDVLSLLNPESQKPIDLPSSILFSKSQMIRTGFEANLVRKDSTQIPIEIFISPISENGSYVGSVLTFQDITERKQAIDQIRRHAMQSEAMLKAAEQLNSRLDVKGVLKEVCEICNITFGVTATSAFLYDPIENDFSSITIAVNKGINDQAFKAEAYSEGYRMPVDIVSGFLSQSEPVLALKDIRKMDFSGLPFFERIKELDIRSLAISGMYQDGSIIGILVSQTYGEFRDFTQDELELLRGLADQASLAIGNARLFEQVVASRERQQTLTRRLVNLQEDERRNLAQELHDQVGQMMTGLQFSLGALLVQPADTLKNSITAAQAQVIKIIELTREISMNLRPSMLDDTGLVLTLMWHFNRYKSQTNIEVNFQHTNLLEKRFETTIEIAVFRIIQEALTNVARHGKCETVDVNLIFDGQVIELEVIDQGQGFILDDVDTTAHMGLSGMQERAYAVGGYLEIETTPLEGTRIYAVIPLKGKVERRQHER